MVQGAFVLCRLFRKQDEKANHSNYDEVEQTGLSSSTNKSSPDDNTSSDALQGTTTTYVQVRRQQEVTWRSDDITSNDHFCPGGCFSDADNHSAEEAATEVRRTDHILIFSLPFQVYFGLIIPTNSMQGFCFLLLL